MIKLFKFLKPYRVSIIFVLILAFVQSLSELYLPNLMSNVVNIGIVKGDVGYILRIGGTMLLIAIISTLCAITASFLSSQISVGFGRILRGKIFAKVESYSLQEFEKIGTSSLITRTTNDIMQIQHCIMIIMRMMISAPMMCIGGIIMAMSKDAKLSLAIIIVICVLIAIISLIAKKVLPLFTAVQSKLDKLNQVLREGLAGIRVIRAFNRGEYEKKRFNDANRDLTEIATKVNRMMGGLMPIMSLIMNFTVIAIIWFGSIRIDNGSIQVGDLMAVTQYVMQILFSLLMFSMIFVMIPRASISASRINEVLNTEISVKDAHKVINANDKKGFVEFKNVTFSYPDAEQPLINDVSFSANPGEITAIIGSTGSGKSTLINLMLRFYDINSGRILVNGIDIMEMSQHDLRNKIGFVPQKAVLFSGTIADNIKYGKQDATDEEIRSAADIAQATEFIQNIENGFNHIIAQDGINISGGQKQRISIARALVKKPEIYIFDDGFSALDFKTEAKLRKALKNTIEDSAMIIVAQRVSAVMDADRIIVLDNGKIAGIGSHKELLKTCKVYSEIVSSQLSEEEI